MHVVLAGGGTAGHIEPALALADALRRRHPRRRHHRRWAPRPAWRPRWSRPAATTVRHVPRVPLPRGPPRTCELPGRLRGAVRTAGRCWTSAAPTWSSASAATSACPPYLAARRRKLPIVVHEANARPGWPTGSAPGSPSTSRPRARPTTCRTAQLIGMPLRRRSPTLDRAGAPRRGPGALRPGPRRPDAAGLRRLAGRAAAQRAVIGGGRRRCARPASRCCTPSGGQLRRRGRGARPGRAGPPYVDRALPGADGPGLRRRRLRAVPRGRDDLRRADRRRAARGLRAAADRQRRAAAQRAAGRRGRRRAARRGRRPGRGLDRGERWSRCSPTPPGSPRWARPRPRTAAATPTRRWPTWCRGDRRRRRSGLDEPSDPGPPDIPAADELGRVHFVGIGGAGMSGIARILLARGVPVSGSDAKDSTALAALRALGATRARRPRGRARRRRGHRRGLHRDPRGQPRARPRPARRAAACCRGPRRCAA